jgi:hypothetical protein
MLRMPPAMLPLIALLALLALLPAGAAVAGPAVEQEATGPETVELPAGTVLRLLASGAALPVLTLDATSTAKVLDRHGDWVRVRWGETAGWVDLSAAPAPDAAGPPAGAGGPRSATEPGAGTGPPDRELTRARELLGDRARLVPLPGFDLWTDVEDPPLLEPLDRLAREVLQLYPRRYGLSLPPVPTTVQLASEGPAARPAAPLGTLVLFADGAAFDTFTAATGGAGGAFTGRTAGSVAALTAAGRGRRELYRLLVHEMVHLLNRAAFAAPPPVWLEEGLAGDLELVPVADDGGLLDVPLGREALRLAGGGRPYGPLIAVDRLRLEAERGRLETPADLAVLDRAAWDASPRRAEIYALAALWVRFFLAGEGAGGEARATAFRAALAAAARGAGDAVPALDAAAEREFRLWLHELGREITAAADRRRRRR